MKSRLVQLVAVLVLHALAAGASAAQPEPLTVTFKNETGLLGVNVNPLKPALADYLQMTGQTGVLALCVARDSVAARAGLRAGDVLATFDNLPLLEPATLVREVKALPIGDSATIRGVRQPALEAMLERGFPRDAEAQYVLAGILSGLDCRTANDARKLNPLALDLLKAAAKQNYLYAQTRLAWIFENGVGVPVSATQAFFWEHQAANLGDPYAQVGVGDAYRRGQGTARNPMQAQIWYDQALAQLEPMADKGDPRAQWVLGNMYRYGIGVDQSKRKAKRWYGKAADQDFAAAKQSLEELEHE